MTRGRGPFHLLLRFSDELYRAGDVIERHRDVLESQGLVWWGKLGRPVSDTRLLELEAQINSGVPTYLFLVQRKGRRYQIVRGDAVAVRRDYPGQERSLVPSYYNKLGLNDLASTWIKLNSLDEAKTEGLREYVVASSGTPVTESLRTSMAAMFLIERARADVGR